MSEDDSSPEPEADINAIYIALFRHHLSQVQAHLAGTDNLRLLSSYIPPTGYWTAEDKDNFFHGLSVHSRFRPDLIAACIKTKTILDVCTYIDALDNALCQNQSLPSLRSELECAMEVSDSWVQWEEANADDLVEVEPKWEAVEQQHREEISAEGASTETIMAVGNAGADFVTWERDKRRYWKQERVLKRLEFHHLTVLEGLLRQADSGIADADAEMQPEDQQHQDSIPVLSPPLPHTTPTTSALAIGDDMIDPLLLQLSQSAPVQVPPHSATNTFEATDHSLLPSKPSSFQARNISSHLPPTSVTLLHPSPNDSSSSLKVDEARGTDPSDLTPSSRRRLQKRLYMRRKRAEQNGEEVISDGAKLRPGRKAKERGPPKPRPEFYKTKNETRSREGEDVYTAAMDVEALPHTLPMRLPHAVRSSRDEGQVQEHNADGSSQDHEKTENSDDDDDDRQRRHTKGGLTRPYRIKKDLAENGIDGRTLVDGNLGLFHLSSLGRLMKLYKAGYDKSTTTTATAISADTIRLLQAILEEFVTEVVHRTIILREQEKEMKGDIKVYGRSHDEVTVEVIEYVLEMMGMGGLTKEKYFAQLLGENGTSKGRNDTEEQPSLGDDEGGSSIEGSPALLPLHRELHPPLVNLPKSLALPTERAASNHEDVCMPAHTDEEDLEAELQEERDLDEEDIRLAHEYEVDLWKQFGLEHKYKNTRKRSGKRAGK